MKKSKSIILIFLLVLILIGAIYLAYTNGLFGKDNEQDENNELPNGTEISNGENVDKKDDYVYIDGVKKIGDIEISNIKIKLIENKKCEFTADVKNTSDKYLEATNLRIKIIDDSGGVDEIFGGGITELAPYEPNSFKTYVLADVTDAVDVEFEIIN